MKSLNDFIEEAAKSVERPKCPEGSYYDPDKDVYLTYEEWKDLG